MELHVTRKAKVDDRAPMDVQVSLAVSPLVDDKVDEFGESHVVAHFHRKPTGVFTYDDFADHLVVYWVVTGQFVPVGGDEPFEGMANEKEFGEIARSVLDRVVQIVGV
jgi:hypothetical protein